MKGLREKEHRRRMAAAAMAFVLCVSLFAGCGSGEDKAPAKEQTTEQEQATTQEAAATDSAATAQTGMQAGTAQTSVEAAPEIEEKKPVLHIYCIGEDFKSRVQDYYPEYESTGDKAGMIGDTEVHWHVYSDASSYREDLDARLAKQAGRSEDGSTLADDEKVDLFIADEAYVRDYVESDLALDVIGDLGITTEELADQFPYTQQIAQDSSGRIKALTWQATPGVFTYRRSIAMDVLGTDDPEKVQEAVADWDRFAQTAEAAGEMDYYMLSAYGDAYEVYADNVESAWVEDGVLNIDPHLEDWAVQTREFVENGYTHGTRKWSDEWRADHTGDGRVFGFFYSSWGIHYTLQDKAEGTSEDEETDEEAVESAVGDYAICKGPEPCHFGGQWIFAAAGTDNADLAADIMRRLTCDPEIMKRITLDIHEFTNTVSGMTEIAEGDYTVDVLGGQNPLPIYIEVAKELSQRYTTSYDDDLDLGFQMSMEDYFAGTVSEIDALEIFRKTALTRYEELSDGEADEAESESE